MDILKAAAVLRPGTSWNLRSGVLEQAEDGTARVAVPTPAELQPVMDSDTTPAFILNSQRTDAIAQFTTDPSGISKLNRAILLTLLDQLNIIRAALPVPLGAITPAQAKTAIQNKLNSGAAD